jgi:succinate dehydrogenase / fumarate reductase cytochrome b subunit
VKKQIMGVTGLLLCGFLVSHLITNSLIYIDARIFNTAAHALITNPLIYLAEAILATIFLTHIILAAKLTIENNRARPQKYYMKKKTGRGSTFASSTMPYTGLITLIFLGLHLYFFKFGPEFEVVYDGVVMRDLARLEMEYFASPLNVAWYVFAMASLGLHVSHGFWSAFQSIGFNHPKYNCTLKCLGKMFGVLVFVGYAALPIFCYLQGVN